MVTGAEMARPKLKVHDGGAAGDTCGHPTKTTGLPCQFPSRENCPYHSTGDAGEPQPPEQLGTEGRAEWNRRVEDLQDAGLLEYVDLGMLESACEMYEEARRCQRAVSKHGPVVQGRNGVKKNPASAKHIKYRKEYRLCISEIRKSVDGKRSMIDDTSSDPLADW